MLVGREMEIECRRRSRAAEPDEVVAPVLERRPEMLLVGLAHEAVDAVGRDHEIGIGKLAGVANLGLEVQLYTK